MRIVVKDSTNRRKVIEVDENEKIKDVKLKLKEKMGINNTNFLLHYNGNILDDDELTVSDYDIVNLGNIIYVGQFKGGIYIYK